MKDGWDAKPQQWWCDNKNVSTLSSFSPARAPNPPTSTTASSCDRSNHNTIWCCSDNRLYYLPRWSESVGNRPHGVRRISLPSITDKCGPVKRLFPFKWWHKNKSLLSAIGPSRAAQPLLCGIRYLLGTISSLIKYLLSMLQNEVAQLFGDILDK